MSLAFNASIARYFEEKPNNSVGLMP